MRYFLSEIFQKNLVEPSDKIREVSKEIIVTKEVPVYVEKVIERIN